MGVLHDISHFLLVRLEEQHICLKFKFKTASEKLKTAFDDNPMGRTHNSDWDSGLKRGEN
jgi:hypothetical protein